MYGENIDKLYAVPIILEARNFFQSRSVSGKEGFKLSSLHQRWLKPKKESEANIYLFRKSDLRKL